MGSEYHSSTEEEEPPEEEESEDENSGTDDELDDVEGEIGAEGQTVERGKDDASVKGSRLKDTTLAFDLSNLDASKDEDGGAK